MNASPDEDKALPDDTSLRVSGRDGLAQRLLAYIRQNPSVLGGADIYMLGIAEPPIRAGMLAAVLLGLHDADRKPAIQKYLIVAPPESDIELYDSLAWDALLSTFQLLAHRELTSPEQKAIRACFQTVTAPTRRSSAVLDLIMSEPERTAVIVLESAGYRDESVGPYISPGAGGALLPEDMWAPQLHYVATTAVQLAQKRDLYIALDTDTLSLNRKALVDLLLSVSGCGFMQLNHDNDPQQILSQRVDQWNKWIQEGLLGRVLREIDCLPSTFDSNRSLLRIQMLHRAGQVPQALQEIRSAMGSECTSDAEIRVKLAKIAQDANASNLAAELLNPAIDQLNSIEYLESALATADDAGAVDLEQRLAERLEALFPGAPGLRRRRYRSLLAARNYAGLHALARETASTTESIDFYEKLDCFLSVSRVPDYGQLIASAKDDRSLADAYRMACVRDALARKLVIHAFDLALPLPTSEGNASAGERLLTDSLQQIFLLSAGGPQLPVAIDRVQTALRTLVERLATDPTNHALRFRLAELLQPSVSGAHGLALIVSLVLELVRRPILLTKSPMSDGASLEWLSNHETFWTTAFNWLETEEPVVIGTLVFPRHLLTENADDILSAIADYLTKAPLADDADVQALHMWLALGASIAPHCSNPDFDLTLVRLGAGKLASSGLFQRARDLSDHALAYGAPTERRRRLRWYVMADVYERGRNHLEGLLAMACTLASDSTAEDEQIWHEITGVARLLRDCGMFEQAYWAIAQAEKLIAQADLPQVNLVRLETLHLQVRLLQLTNSEPSTGDVQALLADTVRHSKAVLERGDLPEPAAALLGELIRYSRQAGASIPDDAQSVLEELQKNIRGGLDRLVSAMSAAAPSAEQLLSLVLVDTPARYSDDIGYDMHNVAVAARRALASDQFIDNAIHASFALELLTDLGVASPGWDEAPRPPATPKLTTEPSEIACAISRDGVNVVQVGFDNRGRLVRVTATGGVLNPAVRESDDVINKQRFDDWADDYPYTYGIDETTPNIFYTTTADLRVSDLPQGPTVVIADASFQPFPPNLLYVHGNFSGRLYPIAASPSLAWLQAARSKGMIGDGRLCAWISTAVGGAESQTLPMIAERLAPTFDQYGFVVDNGPALPSRFAGASLVVVTAHGGIHPEGHYFRVVSDEGVLRVAAKDLANALRNVGVVILFVCSGGRADKHPAANTTLGLSKQILDRGSAAVVASPWPLDARVPSHWLPAFIRHWLQGASLIQANFEANRVVDERFAQDPARGLAMTVFGNPLLRCV